VTLGELRDRALAAGIQTIIEGPGMFPYTRWNSISDAEGDM